MSPSVVPRPLHFQEWHTLLHTEVISALPNVWPGVIIYKGHVTFPDVWQSQAWSHLLTVEVVAHVATCCLGDDGRLRLVEQIALAEGVGRESDGGLFGQGHVSGDDKPLMLRRWTARHILARRLWPRTGRVCRYRGRVAPRRHQVRVHRADCPKATQIKYIRLGTSPFSAIRHVCGR